TFGAVDRLIPPPLTGASVEQIDPAITAAVIRLAHIEHPDTIVRRRMLSNRKPMLEQTLDVILREVDGRPVDVGPNDARRPPHGQFPQRALPTNGGIRR